MEKRFKKLDKNRISEDKSGQFYIIAAVIIIVIILGFATTTNYIRNNGFEKTKVYDLKDELGFEGGKVISYGTYNELNNEDMNKLMEHFTRAYTEYAGDNKRLYFIMGNEDKIEAYTYNDITSGTISLTIGGSNNIFQIRERMKSILPFTITNGKVILNLNGVTYEFKLNSGENFYFVITQDIAGEKYVVEG